jgi:Ca2+-binding EF-hand superfamily protein
MNTRRFMATLIAATSLGMTAPAFAQEGTQDDFMLLFKMKSMDKNKDGMVSKAELMAMMDKAFDMKAKSMGAKGGLMTDAQLQQFLKSLYVGG